MKRTYSAILISLLTACGGSGPSGPTFEDLIDEGWLAFEQGDYQTASEKFVEASQKNPDTAVAFTGSGWSFFKLDNLSRANTEFTSGSSALNPSADTFAGWAFVLNAQKNYAQSNQQISQALTLDADWSFPHGLPLDSDDLHILKAANHFLLGEFTSSLSEVQILNSAFLTDVTTSDGRSALAQEIERLKATL